MTTFVSGGGGHPPFPHSSILNPISTPASISHTIRFQPTPTEDRDSAGRRSGDGAGLPGVYEGSVVALRSHHPIPFP